MPDDKNHDDEQAAHDRFTWGEGDIEIIDPGRPSDSRVAPYQASPWTVYQTEAGA
jgi:hypothetical protein